MLGYRERVARLYGHRLRVLDPVWTLVSKYRRCLSVMSPCRRAGRRCHTQQHIASPRGGTTLGVGAPCPSPIPSRKDTTVGKAARVQSDIVLPMCRTYCADFDRAASAKIVT